MTVDIYDGQNNKTGTMDFPERIFGVKWNPDLVHQALTVQVANRRQMLAHVKDRGEVSGGGKKPWKQKGTGRARHGSTRSPIWVGGGVSHGPKKERQFAKKISKKMRRLAIFSVISRKLKDKEIKIMDGFSANFSKTKETAKALNSLFGAKPNVLLIASSAGKGIKKAVSNIEKTDAISAKSLNVYDLLKHKNILFEKEAVEEIAKNYA